MPYLFFTTSSLLFLLEKPTDNLSVSYDHSQVQALGVEGRSDLSKGGESPTTSPPFISSEAKVFWNSGHDERHLCPDFYLRGLMRFREKGCASIYKFIKLCHWLTDFQVHLR